MKINYQLNLATQFSRFPAGRYKSDGPYSGEAFRDDFLIPYLREHKKVVVELDGALGYGSSFLEEAFGGLVRAGFRPAEIFDLIELHSRDESLINEIQSYIQHA